MGFLGPSLILSTNHIFGAEPSIGIVEGAYEPLNALRPSALNTNLAFPSPKTKKKSQ